MVLAVIAGFTLRFGRLERGFGGLFLNLLRRRTRPNGGVAGPRAAPRRRPPKRLKLLLSHLRTPERAKSNPRPLTSQKKRKPLRGHKEGPNKPSRVNWTIRGMILNNDALTRFRGLNVRFRG